MEISSLLLTNVFSQEVVKAERKGGCSSDHKFSNIGAFQTVRFKKPYYSAEYPDGIINPLFSTYEIADMCKTWAKLNNFDLYSLKELENGKCLVFKSESNYWEDMLETFTAKTEQEAVILACEWIVENLKKERSNNASE